MNRILLILSAATLLASGANAQTVLYGNLNATVNSYFTVCCDGPLYNSFSTGATNQVLTDVKLYLSLVEGASGTTTVTLYADNNSTPGNQLQVLGTINDNSIGDPGVFDVPVNPGVTLSPNTRYWIGLSTSNESDIEWASTDSTSGTGNIANEFYCFWGFFNRPTGAPAKPMAHGEATSLGCFSNIVSNDPFLMQVTASPMNTVPAPDLSFTGMVLLSLLLAACAAVFLRRASMAS